MCNVDGGTHTRTRSIIRTASCGGKCEATRSTQNCTVQPVQCQVCYLTEKYINLMMKSTV